MTDLLVPEDLWPLANRQRTGRTSVADYVRDVQKDLTLLSPHLPEKPRRIIDIGCGLAAIDVLLKRRYPDAELWLLDGDGDDPRCGWNDTLTAFNQRKATERLLSANGVQHDRWLDIGTTETLEADLVISLASWGYHYPLSTYTVKSPCIIADLRRPQEKARGTVIGEYRKRNRCVWSQ